MYHIETEVVKSNIRSAAHWFVVHECEFDPNSNAVGCAFQVMYRGLYCPIVGCFNEERLSAENQMRLYRAYVADVEDKLESARVALKYIDGRDKRRAYIADVLERIYYKIDKRRSAHERRRYDRKTN